MIELTPENVADFLKRFTFYDGSVLDVYLCYGSDPFRRARVKLLVRDNEPATKDLALVLLDFWEVGEFTLVEADYRHFPNEWIQYGVAVGFFNEFTYVDFSPFPDDIHVSPNRLEQFRDSTFYISAKRVWWSVRPYREGEGSENWPLPGSE